MDTLVDRPGLNIQVRDAAGYSVCVTCRGAKTRWRTDYESAPYGCLPRLTVHNEYLCQSCGGAGFWRELPHA